MNTLVVNNDSLTSNSDYVYAGAIGNGTANITLTKTGNKKLTLSGVQSYSILNTQAGTTNLNSSLPNAVINNNAGVLNINANANGSTVNAHAITNISTSQTLAALNVDSTAAVTVLSHPAGFANVRVIATSGLSFASNTNYRSKNTESIEPRSLESFPGRVALPCHTSS